MAISVIKRYQGIIPDALKSLHPILQRVYAARGVTTLEDVDYQLSHLLHFKSLKGIEAATNLLAEAIDAQQQILIVGDFDTDGATSTALMQLALKSFGAKHVSYLVPNRFEYGYGLTPEIVKVAGNPDLIITVDNGIASHEGVLAAQQLGAKVLITDHHLPPETLPLADAIVNPQQLGDAFPSKNLAGVGVAFYVMLALRDHLNKTRWFQDQKIPYPSMTPLLDLVALGTVADMVPLDRNNRILVSRGLERIRMSKVRPGLAALVSVANQALKNCQASHLSFLIAPKLNAAGRLKDMSIGIECLLTESALEARALADQLDDLNKERQSIESKMQAHAFERLDKLNISGSQRSICLFDQNWHQGITGLVAGRLKERFQKPTVILAPSTQTSELKGSARSIPGVHIRDVLANISVQFPNLIKRFGGHAAAAGLTLHASNYSEFSIRFEEGVTHALKNGAVLMNLTSDGELAAHDLTLDTAYLIESGGPWGQGFSEPTFEGWFDIVTQRLVGQRHLSLLLSREGLVSPVKAIVFNIDTSVWPNFRIHAIKILYQLTVNEWQKRRNIQLQVIKVCEASEHRALSMT